MNTQLKLFFILFVSALCLGFTSCNDDDEETDYAKEIAGTYKGTIKIDMIGFNEAAEITIKRDSKNKVIVSMNQDLGIGKVIEVDIESSVGYSNSLYAIQGTTTFDLGEIESPLPLPSSLPVVMAGTIDKSGNASIEIVLATMVSAEFEGKKQ